MQATYMSRDVACFFCPSNPSTAFRGAFGLDLVGPFDVLAGRFASAGNIDSDSLVVHWRYYYDPPEFQVRKL